MQNKRRQLFPEFNQQDFGKKAHVGSTYALHCKICRVGMHKGSLLHNAAAAYLYAHSIKSKRLRFED